MIAEHFDKALQAHQRRRPFRSFAVRFVSSEQIDVDHPEAMVVRGGVGVYVNAAGVPTLFDHESISEVVGETERRSAKTRFISRGDNFFFAGTIAEIRQPPAELSDCYARFACDACP